ncbi:MAG: anti-sigma factor [Chloroflexi bacterium]|nr:anti-sigma factor [Chloroflexota bacterium]
MSSRNDTHAAPDCDSVELLIPDYAFGLTTPEETRLVETNLAACPEAVAQLADYRQLQDEMRLSVPQIEPSPDLEARLMAAIAPAAPAQTPRRVQPLAWLAAAAIVALALTNIYWLVRVNDLTARQAELAAQLQSQNETAFVLTSTNHLRWVRLPPEQEGGDATAFLMWNAESEIGLMYARGFPQPSPGRTYQLWLTQGDQRVSAGTFTVNEEGIGALLFHVTEPIDEYTWARITEEPATGSDQPEGTVIVHGEL